MAYNYEQDKKELYTLEFKEFDGVKVAKKLQKIIRTYTPDDLEKVATSYGKYDDDEYEGVSNAEFLKQTAEHYKKYGIQ